LIRFFKIKNLFCIKITLNNRTQPSFILWDKMSFIWRSLHYATNVRNFKFTNSSDSNERYSSPKRVKRPSN